MSRLPERGSLEFGAYSSRHMVDVWVAAYLISLAACVHVGWKLQCQGSSPMANIHCTTVPMYIDGLWTPKHGPI